MCLVETQTLWAAAVVPPSGGLRFLPAPPAPPPPGGLLFAPGRPVAPPDLEDDAVLLEASPRVQTGMTSSSRILRMATWTT